MSNLLFSAARSMLILLAFGMTLAGCTTPVSHVCAPPFQAPANLTNYQGEPLPPLNSSGQTPSLGDALNGYLQAIEQATGYRDAYHALAEYEKGSYIVRQNAYTQP